MSSRFFPHDVVLTDAVLSLDEDSVLSTNEVSPCLLFLQTDELRHWCFITKNKVRLPHSQNTRPPKHHNHTSGLLSRILNKSPNSLRKETDSPQMPARDWLQLFCVALLWYRNYLSHWRFTNRCSAELLLLWGEWLEEDCVGCSECKIIVYFAVLNRHTGFKKVLTAWGFSSGWTADSVDVSFSIFVWFVMRLSHWLLIFSSHLMVKYYSTWPHESS